MEPKTKAVLWDFDGTLANTKQPKWEQYATVGSIYYGRTEAEVYEVLGRVWGQGYTEELLREIFGPGAKDDSFGLMDQHKRSREADFPALPIDHALETVVNLQQRGFWQGIVSNSNHELIEFDLRRLGFPIEAFFEIQATEDAAVCKPDPAVFDPIVARLATYGVQRGEIRYVGDSLADGRCAQAAKIGFIGVASGDVPVKSFQAQGMQAVPHLGELAQYLQLRS